MQDAPEAHEQPQSGPWSQFGVSLWTRLAGDAMPGEGHSRIDSSDSSGVGAEDRHSVLPAPLDVDGVRTADAGRGH